MSTVSFVIPSYNGLHLLQKNLPSVYNDMQSHDELIIVEDAGTDNTATYFVNKYQLDIHQENKNYTWWKKNIKVGNGKKSPEISFNLVLNKENQRFARSCNVGASLASGDLIFLLNNDVAPHTGARHQLASHFNDSTVFAVGAREIEANIGKESGKNRLWWQKGRFHHSGESVKKSGSTAWASGGSAMFDRHKWLELGGFDDLYYPAYWEDIDFSFVARKKGYQVLFDHQAVVDHNHETTNQSVFGQKKIEQISFDNGTKFAWKNSNFWQKLQFLFFYPYWYFKRQPAKLLWLAVILLALLLRLFALGTLPTGPTVDEAAIGYNGTAIAKARRDEWLNRLPVSFRSFGDYKAPLAIYIVAAESLLLPINLFTLRLPFALASVLSIWGIMKIVYLILGKEKDKTVLAALAGLATTLLPWHLHFGRLGFENNYALALIAWGIYFLLSGLSKNRTTRGILWSKKWFSAQFILSGVLLALSLYAYHSSKIFVPVFLLVIIVMWWRPLLERWKICLTAFFIAFLLLLPLLKDNLYGEGFTRASSSFLLSTDLTVDKKLLATCQGMITHLSPQFLIFGHTDTLRHGNGQDGVLNVIVIFFVLISIYALFIKDKNNRAPYTKWWWFGLFWLIIGLLPAAITFDLPHSNRAFLTLPGFMILFTLGVVSLKHWLEIRQHHDFVKSYYMLAVILLFFSFFNYLSHYLDNYHQTTLLTGDKQNYSQVFNEGLNQSLQIARSLEKEVAQIVVMTSTQHPYIHTLFVRGTNPIAYQGGSLSEKYLFLDSVSQHELDKSDVLLIIENTSDLENLQPAHVEWQQEILGRDGKVKYLVVKTLPTETL